MSQYSQIAWLTQVLEDFYAETTGHRDYRVFFTDDLERDGIVCTVFHRGFKVGSHAAKPPTDRNPGFSPEFVREWFNKFTDEITRIVWEHHEAGSPLPAPQPKRILRP